MHNISFFYTNVNCCKARYIIYRVSHKLLQSQIHFIQGVPQKTLRKVLQLSSWFVKKILYINLACLSGCLFVCLSVCLYPINLKTAEPIGPKFCAVPRSHDTRTENFGMVNIEINA